MRVFPTTLRGLILAGALSLVISSGAHAVNSGNDSVAAIQIKLVQAREHLNSLYDSAAVASERLNGAIYRAQLAKAEVVRDAAGITKAEQGLKIQRQAVAELTMQELQSNSGLERFNSLLDSGGPVQLLDRSSAYSSTQDAMSAHIASLAASTVVYDAARRRAAAGEAQRRAALAGEAAAKAAIEQDIATAEATLKQTTAQRTVLLAKLARAQNLSLATVTKRQNAIDRSLDAQPGTPAAGPSNPAPPGPTSNPAPTSNPPTTGGATTPPAAPAPPPPANPPPANPPPAPSNTVETAIAFAKAQLGDPYQWGAAGPNSWDCSGLTMKAYAAAGISLPHYGVAQYQAITPVSVGSIRRGDLLFWSYGSVDSIYHVAMYLGGGQMIQAPRTGRNVEIVSLSYWIRPDLAGRPG